MVVILGTNNLLMALNLWLDSRGRLCGDDVPRWSVRRKASRCFWGYWLLHYGFCRHHLRGLSDKLDGRNLELFDDVLP